MTVQRNQFDLLSNLMVTYSSVRVAHYTRDINQTRSYTEENEKSYCPQQVVFRNGLHFAVYTVVYTAVYTLWFTLQFTLCSLHFVVYTLWFTWRMKMGMWPSTHPIFLNK